MNAMRVALRGELALVIGYLGGVAGTLWDWHEHYVGGQVTAPHILIDVSGLLVLAVLAFTDWRKYGAAHYLAIYVLLVLVAVVFFGPFLLMMTAPHSALMPALMSLAMTRGALALFVPLVALSAWAAWHWLGLSRMTPARMAAAIGVVVVAGASVWDLYWHQTRPMEMGASMNMMTLPPHQLILAGFVLGLIGSASLLITYPARSAWPSSWLQGVRARWR